MLCEEIDSKPNIASSLNQRCLIEHRDRCGSFGQKWINLVLKCWASLFERRNTCGSSGKKVTSLALKNKAKELLWRSCRASNGQYPVINVELCAEKTRVSKTGAERHFQVIWGQEKQISIHVNAADPFSSRTML